MKSGGRHVAVWEKRLPSRGSLGPEVGRSMVCSLNTGEASIDKEQGARSRVMEMRSEGPEEAKSFRALRP